MQTPIFKCGNMSMNFNIFKQKNANLIKAAQQQKNVHHKTLATLLTLTMSTHACPYLIYSKVISFTSFGLMLQILFKSQRGYLMSDI